MPGAVVFRYIHILYMGMSAESTVRLLNSLMAQSTIPFAILEGPEHTFAICNPAYEKLAGRKITLGKTVLQQIPELKGQGYIELLDKVYQTGIQYQAHDVLVQLKNPHSDVLEDFYMDFTYSAFRDPNQGVKGIIVIATDVTAEHSLREERERLKSYINQAPVAMAILRGPEHRFELHNQLYAQFVGSRDLLGRSVREAFPEIERQGFYELLDQVYQTGTPFEAHDSPVSLRRGPDGELENFYQDFTYQPFRGASGRVEGIIVTAVDVTDRVMARLAIQNQQKWLETVLDQLPFALVMVKPVTGEYQFINKSAQKIFGTAAVPENADLKSYARYFDVSDLSGRRLSPDEFPSKRAARGEKIQNEQIIWGTPSGSYFLNVSATKIPAMHGHPETLLVPFQDITDLKKKEAALSESEGRLNSAVAASRLGFWEWNIQNDSVIWSDHLRQDWGFPEGVLSSSLAEIQSKIHPDDIELVRNALSASLKDGVTYDIEFRVNKTPSETVWIHGKGQTFFLPDGRAHRMTGTTLDVTARKFAEATVRESEVQFSLLADAMPQIVWVANAQGQLTYTNRRWTEYSGSDAPSDWLHFVHFEDRERTTQTWGESVATGTPYEAEFRLLREADQTYRWHLVRAIPVSNEIGKIIRWYGTCTDVTAQKELQIDLNKAKEQAEVANNLKTAFLANMSHEIRTPLGAILGFTELMQGSDLRQDQREHLNVISRNGRALARLIDDILDISKVEAGKMELEFVSFSFKTLLAEVVELFGETVRAKKISLKIENEDQLPDQIVSDPSRLRQILVNIVGNAVKFTTHGGVRLQVVTRDLGNKRAELLISVIDTGPGLTAEQASKLFVPFTQADNSVRRKHGGTGLGLVLARKLAEGLGGNVRLKDCPQKVGCTFEILMNVGLDRTAAALVSRSEKAASTKKGSKRLDGIRVLSVDDTADNRNLIRHFLSRESAHVDEAENGDQAVSMALSTHYDVILMDIQMPVSDGYSALQALQKMNYGSPVIALTAHAMLEERRRTQEAGFRDHLTKPIDPNHLVDVILKNTRGSHSSGTT